MGLIYSVLRRRLETYTANTDPEYLGEIDGFIRQAESTIGNLVDIPAYLKTASLVSVAANPFISLPAQSTPVTDFISVEDLTVDGYGIIQQKSTGFLREAFPDSSEQGPTRYFAMANDQTLMLGPIPDQVYSYGMFYRAKWPSLVDLGKSSGTASQSTFIADKFEAGLIHASLYYANMYMKSQIGVALEEKEMLRALGLLDEFAEGDAKASGSEKYNSSNMARVKK